MDQEVSSGMQHPPRSAVAAAARERGRLGIDTEFMSEGRYRALLCLVQIAARTPGPDGENRILLIDPLGECRRLAISRAARRRRDRSRPPRRPAGRGDPPPRLEHRAEEHVRHAGRRRVCRRRRADGLRNLLAAILGRRVGKTASYTRWDARPLTEEQLGYAAEDVVHLLELADELQRRLGDRPIRLGSRGVPPARVRDR